MSKDLVIVESPAKARTVERFLGSKYEALASMGHVRDLPRGSIGVEVDESGFHPSYSVMPDKKKIVSQLKKASETAGTVYLATDPDREGEAISWHLIKAAKINEKKIKRVVFHEITKRAIEEAFANPRNLDMDLIDAYQARRVLDRIVGYRLSPVLWRLVSGGRRRGLSAGRVQSVALRMVVDREQEIQDFIPLEYWSLDAMLSVELEGKPHVFKSLLHSIKGQKGEIEIPDETAANEILADLKMVEFNVDSVRKREVKSRPSAPFITSTLQQEASRKLRFTARRSMQVAQQLYQGISIGNEGSVGLITYMRTDSTNVATSALDEASVYIKKKFGNGYASTSHRLYSKKVRGAQEAHEAIRPTSVDRDPESVRQYLTDEQFRLYELIWKRMLASQMTDALFDSTTVDITAEGNSSGRVYVFRSKGSVLKFQGFRMIYIEDTDESNSDNDTNEAITLPDLSENDVLKAESLTEHQHFTKPPPRYSESTLIKALEDQGIGRPSTYASIVGTIMARDYVRKESSRFVPTKVGIAVTGLLKEHFPDVMDIGFTAHIEEELDDIAQGDRAWEPVLRDFYGPFDESIDRAMKEGQRVPSSQLDEESDEVCEKCESPMVIKTGRFGPFLGCSGFPECRNIRPHLIRTGVECPDCGGDLVERRGRGRNARTFYGCSNYPTCNFALSRKPLPQPCPECSNILLASGRDRAKCSSCEYSGAVPDGEAVEIAL